MEVGEGEIIYLSLHCHHKNDFCIKMGSDESHFNVSVGSDGQSHKTVSTNHNLFEEKLYIYIKPSALCVQSHDPLTFSFLSSFLFFDWARVLWP